MSRNKTWLESFGLAISKALLHGLITILPFSLTIGLFMFSIRVVVAWFKPIQEFFSHPIAFISTIEYKAIANQLLLVLLALLFFGLIIRTLLLRSIIDKIEELIFKIPLVRPVYSGIKQLIHAFSVQDKLTFKKVVVVEFPRDGVYSLGFLTSELPQSVSPQEGVKCYNVFIPTTPNPTSGFFVILPEGSFKTINLTRQEAMAMIISGGIIQPDRLMKE